MHIVAIEAGSLSCRRHPPSKGRLGVDGTVLLGHDDRQLGLSQFKFDGNLVTLVRMAKVHLGSSSICCSSSIVISLMFEKDDEAGREEIGLDARLLLC
ncbi:hypothetical protein [Agrobacterium salinitolerans]|uniref:hypothetical protein n=1 Tax=Agrobacterium salinitolerans TaxID=1183413 RepID=UPI00157442E1|nr:hypothetical protein [Agrobacterium salinitolerans]NTA40215.1 hypothetical protein [Agrobacterium salinitolerans]